MPFIVKYKSLGVNPKEKSIELPDGSTWIHLEYGGWTADDGIFLWWRNKYDQDRCKKLVTTKWPYKLKHFKITIEKI